MSIVEWIRTREEPTEHESIEREDARRAPSAPPAPAERGGAGPDRGDRSPDVTPIDEREAPRGPQTEPRPSETSADEHDGLSPLQPNERDE